MLTRAAPAATGGFGCGGIAVFAVIRRRTLGFGVGATTAGATAVGAATVGAATVREWLLRVDQSIRANRLLTRAAPARAGGFGCGEIAVFAVIRRRALGFDAGATTAGATTAGATTAGATTVRESANRSRARKQAVASTD